ncbi:glutathione S-transferase C-terminal domain-containing protein [Methylobrevis pamukkalensis]|uniref:Beta-etherase n=1 Tax=Methylobrevis pamukkalensis TaxID=1439726 RepID=A0A1E3GX11_9HYPH|nr:glutathione S-transferase C-terminal domain-containing protein [Methylobrevis pamukkalensis]ODN68554.1 Beta-etherase [Methylobrevis pamukkalensis]
MLEDGETKIGDSFAIAEHLEATWPDRPALFAPGESGRAVARLVEGYANLTVGAALMPFIVKDIHDLLAPADQTYFRTTREKRLGRTLEEVQAGRENRTDEIRKALAPMRHMLRSAPFIGGASPLYVDYIVAGHLIWATTVTAFPILDGEAEVTAWLARVRAA